MNDLEKFIQARCTCAPAPVPAAGMGARERCHGLPVDWPSPVLEIEGEGCAPCGVKVRQLKRLTGRFRKDNVEGPGVFVGHAAVALAAKKRAPTVSLGWLMAAAFGLDLIWPVLVLLGVEHFSIAPGATAFTPFLFDDYPWSHSLLMSLAWGAAAFGIARWRRVPRGPSLIVGALVVSHWILDFITHQPDLPLWPGTSPRLGLGLWNSVTGTLLIEGAIYITGILIYTRAVRAKDAAGRFALWPLLILLAAVWASGPWSPPPPGPQAVALVALSVWLFIGWAGWVDRHRMVRADAGDPVAPRGRA